MNLDIFNNLLNNAKENGFVQNFMKELSNYLEKANKNLSTQDNSLKEEGGLYQVVEMGVDSAYLQNVNKNKVSEEKDISKEILDQIGNDTVLRYKDGQYVVEEGITQDFFDSLIGIKEYESIQEKFIMESNISQIDSNTRYNVKERGNDYTILNYGNDGKETIKVPNELIPFWTNNESVLYYEDGKFNRDL